MTKAPAAVTYASVVSRETVRTALTLVVALNEIKAKCGDAMYAYITAPCTEKIWNILGVEFGANAWTRVLIIRALYDLKSSGADFRKHLRECVGHCIPSFTRFWVGPVNDPHMGPILQARPPHGAVSNHAVDGGFEPEPSAPEASQHSAIPPTWVA